MYGIFWLVLTKKMPFAISKAKQLKPRVTIIQRSESYSMVRIRLLLTIISRNLVSYQCKARGRICYNNRVTPCSRFAVRHGACIATRCVFQFKSEVRTSNVFLKIIQGQQSLRVSALRMINTVVKEIDDPDKSGIVSLQ